MRVFYAFVVQVFLFLCAWPLGARAEERAIEVVTQLQTLDCPSGPQLTKAVLALGAQLPEGPTRVLYAKRPNGEFDAVILFEDNSTKTFTTTEKCSALVDVLALSISMRQVTVTTLPAQQSRKRHSFLFGLLGAVEGTLFEMPTVSAAFRLETQFSWRFFQLRLGARTALPLQYTTNGTTFAAWNVHALISACSPRWHLEGCLVSEVGLLRVSRGTTVGVSPHINFGATVNWRAIQKPKFEFIPYFGVLGLLTPTQLTLENVTRWTTPNVHILLGFYFLWRPI